MMRKVNNCNKAATMVEFAIVIPITLFFILILIDLSLYYFVKNSIDRGAKLAATYASTEPGLDSWDTNTNQRNNQPAIEKLEAKFMNPNTGAPQLPMLFVSTGMVHNFNVEFIPPDGSATNKDAFKDNPMGFRITAEYHSLVGFLPFMPKTIQSTAFAYREYQANSSNPIPVDCLGVPYAPNNPAVVNPGLCPCVGSNDPLARRDPNNPGLCACPNGLDPGPDGLCSCPAGSSFFPRTGMCQCDAGRIPINGGQICACRPCTDPGAQQNPNDCSCLSCPNTCGSGARAAMPLCACVCPNPQHEYVNNTCQCKSSDRESCLAQGDRIFLPVSGNNRCECKQCDPPAGGEDNFFNPSEDGTRCECDINALTQFCANQDPPLNVNLANCGCVPKCTPGEDRTVRNCECDLTSSICQEQNLGNVDPKFCQCSGRCVFETPPAGSPPTPPIPNPSCPCDREKLGVLCGGMEYNHPVYCTCICKDPNPANCRGPCDPNAWVQNCAYKPEGDPLGLPFDWDLYNRTGICACAEGRCTGDTVLNSEGRCVCKPEVINDLSTNICPGSTIIQVNQGGVTKCKCGTECTNYQQLTNNSCACFGAVGCNDLNCMKTNYPSQYQAWVAACGDQDRVISDFASCSCGDLCPEPRRIVGDQCVCDDLNNRRAACQRDNGVFNQQTCECEKTCTGGYFDYSTNPPTCRACPVGNIYLRCAAQGTACTATSCCAPPSCAILSSNCECRNGNWYVEVEE